MKRPSGFDREPEPPEPEALRSEPPAPAVPESEVPRVSVPEEPEALAASVAPEPDRAVSETGIAPTVDLSEVRQRRMQDLIVSARAERPADPVKAAERRVREAEKQRRSQERRESRRFSAEARRRRRHWWIVLGTVAALALFVVAGVFTPLMSVREIRLVGAENVDAAKVEEALARFEGVPIALVRDSEVHRALEPFPRIQGYSMELIPPSTLLVRIEERVAVVSLKKDGKFGIFDAAGVQLGSADAAPEGVPVASGTAADLSSEAFQSAARALRDIPLELRKQVVKVAASSGHDVTFTLANGVEVLWGDAEENRRKAVVLQRMLTSLESAGRAVEQIDVSSSSAPVFH